jgi:hypothetical protein
MAMGAHVQGIGRRIVAVLQFFQISARYGPPGNETSPVGWAWHQQIQYLSHCRLSLRDSSVVAPKSVFGNGPLSLPGYGMLLKQAVSESQHLFPDRSWVDS